MKGCGTIPDTMVSLMMTVMVGIKLSRHSCTRYVGTGSGMYDFFGVLRTMFFTCCSVAREMVSKEGPQKTEKSGYPDVALSSSLNLWVFAEKKSPNVSISGRSTVGIELERVLSFFLPDNCSVMWKRSLQEEQLLIVLDI